MKYVQALLCATVLLLSASAARADDQKQSWHIVGSDGCSEYIYEYDIFNHTWQTWWHCCGTSNWCHDAQGFVDPCGSGVVLPSGPGSPVAYTAEGDRIVLVTPGRGGYIGPGAGGEGTCFAFTPNGGDVIVISHAAQ